MLLKIGELAKRTGLTIRALRHYDAIHLLVPSIRSDAGYRLYNREDVAKLYRIQALRRLDLSLTEIQSILSGGAAGLPDVITQQISFLGRQIQQASALRTHLIALQGQLEERNEPAIDDWLIALESMVTGAKYFTDDELGKLKAQRGACADTVESERAGLIVALRELIERGISPESPEAHAVAHRWIELLLDEVGGDEGLLIKLYTMHWNEAALHSLTGIDQTGMQYISHAMAYGRLEIYANYCLPEEIAHLRRHYVEQTAAWPPLIAAIRDQMVQGAQPDNMAMQALARCWQALSHAKTGGDLKLELKLQAAFQNEPALRLGSGIDAPLMAFIDDAISALDAKQFNNDIEKGNQ